MNTVAKKPVAKGVAEKDTRTASAKKAPAAKTARAKAAATNIEETKKPARVAKSAVPAKADEPKATKTPKRAATGTAAPSNSLSLDEILGAPNKEAAPQKPTRMNVDFEPAIYQGLKQMALDRNQSLAEIVRRMVTAVVIKHQNQAQA